MRDRDPRHPGMCRASVAAAPLAHLSASHRCSDAVHLPRSRKTRPSLRRGETDGVVSSPAYDVIIVTRDTSPDRRAGARELEDHHNIAPSPTTLTTAVVIMAGRTAAVFPGASSSCWTAAALFG